MHRRKSLVLLLGMVLSISGSSIIGASLDAAFTIEGRVRTVQDGDTLTIVAKNGARFPIRLADLDAPEIAHRSQASDKTQRRLRPGQVHGRAAQTGVPDVPGAVPMRIKFDAQTWLFVRGVLEQNESHARGMAAEDGEVDAVAALMQAERKRLATTEAHAAVAIR